MNDQRQDDFDRGVRNRRAVLGDAWVDRSLDGATAFNADFQHLITRYAWHDIWGRPGLDRQTRRLLVLGMTMAAARWEEFELHCRAAVRGGVPLEAIRETLMQGAIYCGVPAANTAFKLTLEILRSEGLAPPPAPLTAGTRPAVHHTFSQPQLRVALQGLDAGTPVVLSHALGLTHAMWDGLADGLGRAHPVLRYDHRGHGGSASPPAPWTMDDLVDDAARLVREWGRGPVVFVGLSMGGMVAQGLAIRHPELVRALVLANTTAHYPAEARPMWEQRIAAVRAGGLAAVADAAVERFLSPAARAARPALAEGLRAVLLRSDPEGYVAACGAVAGVDWRAGLAAIRVPTLVLAGELDAGTTPAMAEAVAAAIPGARLEVLPGVAHLSAAEAPEAFQATVERFLAGVG